MSSAPHHGTPLAQHFTSLFGSQLLKLLSLATVYSLRTGRLPVGRGAPARAACCAGRTPTPTGVVDQLFLQLLSDFAGKRRRAIEQFFSSVHSDQGLVPQLAPGAMELFNAATPDRAGVRYGEVVTRARPPGIRSLAARRAGRVRADDPRALRRCCTGSPVAGPAIRPESSHPSTGSSSGEPTEASPITRPTTASSPR